MANDAARFLMGGYCNSPTGAQLMAKLSIVLASLLLNGNFSASTPPTSESGVVSKQAGVADQALWPVTSVAGTSRSATADESCTALELRSINLINNERKARRLPVLLVNPVLVRVAREHSREMWEKGYFDHYSPTPELRTPMQRYLKELGRTPTW
ncbi:MAG: CAP domain-containing protein, partial [Armatimonadetes bacterium]|nr:CAP domain-containing protein [Armatimonadota bacterium]